ncbi:MAG: hypothetical protein AAGF11_56740 [Myxococcota bacterium]
MSEGKFHTIAAGEDLASLAEEYGFRHWETIYDHPRNDDLREQRPNPFALCEGDKVWVPAKEPKTHRCKTGTRHTFRVRRPRTRVRLMMVADDDRPYAGCKYTLKVGDETFEGSTGPDGSLVHEVPASETAGTLTLWTPEAEEPEQWDLELGGLDSVTTKEGLKQRMSNLGLMTEGGDDAALLEAVNALRRRHGQAALTSADEIDPVTREAVAMAYGCEDHAYFGTED